MNQETLAAPSVLRTGTGAESAEVVLVTGISGSGKSVALHALEDAGYFCVDNLPPELLHEFIRLEHARFTTRVAVAVDVRTAGSLPHLLPLVAQLRQEGVNVRLLFLDAATEVLVRRYSETRRPHPLSKLGAAGDRVQALVESIDLERLLLAELRDISNVVDTSQLRPVQLRNWVRDMVGARRSSLTLVFESFAFKHGVPLDADYVFDMRVLPNPFYVKELRALTGQDETVANYLHAQPEVGEMLAQIEAFIRRWLPGFAADQRSYLTIALGCTGGQHRSVYGVEVLSKRFSASETNMAAVLRDALTQLEDAGRSLHSYLGHREPDPGRLQELDNRLASWMAMARRYRRQPGELPALLSAWQTELKALDAAADIQALESQVAQALTQWQLQARAVSQARKGAAPRWAKSITAAMQHLGMAGGRFEVQLLPQAEPQAFGAETVEFLVAGHAGSSPRPLAKVASGGELSRLALAIAATSAQSAQAAPKGASAKSKAAATDGPATLIFDEIDAGIGGDVAHAVGRLMKQLGLRTQVLAVTHLAQVAACADAHWVVSKQERGRSTISNVQPVAGETRVSEIARMLGGGHLAQTSRAHALALLEDRA